jgi:hypothetical protein
MAEKLREFIAEYGAAREARYKEYRALLDRAVAAGVQAVHEVPAVPRGQRRRGAVWLRVADGRSSFARFVMTQDTGVTWRRGNRKMGNHAPVDFPDIRQSLAYAQAIRDVLASGGVTVTVEHSSITERSTRASR